MSKYIYIFVGVVILIIAVVFYYNFSRSPQSSTNPALTIPAVTVFSQNLDVPWAIAFLPDGRLLVTERKGTVRIVNNNGTVEQNPVATINVDLEPGSEGGLLGITLDPDFTQKHFVYLYYTYQSGGKETLNRVVRMKFDQDKLSQEEIIVDKIPGALYHNGGRIKFGPDGNLYITTGDAQNPSQAQNTNSLAGKILKVVGQNVSVYSYGHRNPQGIAWDRQGQLWETEHGNSHFDEINLILEGKNYGWNVIQGSETKSGMETPQLNSGASETWAPAGAVFVGNSLFFAGLRGVTLYEAAIENNNVINLRKHLVGQYGRLREVVLGPDNMLYITTSNKDGRGLPGSGDDKIIRVNPQKL